MKNLRSKKIAAFTLARNEPIFLRVWCNYYGRFFPHEDIFILNNSSDDGSIEEIKKLFQQDLIDIGQHTV